MLRRLGPHATLDRPAGLEFNPPAHGTWNIVHIGMLVPQAHQIYICAVNCMRGVVLTAAEMGAQDRFSCVVLKEEDITRGDVERITLEGIADVLRKLEARGQLPPCVIVFPVCTHLFLGINMAHIYRVLERTFPSVDFVRAFMDPISKRRLIPDQRLRKVMYDPVPVLEPDPNLVVLLGSDIAPNKDADLRLLLASANKRLQSIHDCATYDEFKRLGHASAFVCTYPGGLFGAKKTAQRFGRPLLYLPAGFNYDEIETQERTLAEAFDLPLPRLGQERAACDAALANVRKELAGAPIALDALAHPRPLGLARLLLEHDFNVRELYLDVPNPEEADELEWLAANAPDVLVSPMTSADMRIAARTRDERTLAIGQRAAWFCGTDRFVNIVQGGGLWGFAGIRTLAQLMLDAWREPKDTRDLIPRKGLTCPSCF